jgi:hypothetical protein
VGGIATMGLAYSHYTVIILINIIPGIVIELL